MKVLFAGFAAFAAGLAVLPCGAQSSNSAQSLKQPVQAAPPIPGRVIFSRSTDANGKTTTVVGDAAENSDGQALADPVAAEPVATNIDRQAIRFTAYDMDVHLDAARQHIAVRAQVTVPN